jgi:hypothetical protein
MDAKLTLMFVLIGTIVGLSHLGSADGLRRNIAAGRWRQIVPGWRRH